MAAFSRNVAQLSVSKRQGIGGFRLKRLLKKNIVEHTCIRFTEVFDKLRATSVSPKANEATWILICIEGSGLDMLVGVGQVNGKGL